MAGVSVLRLPSGGTAVGLHHGVVERASGPGYPPVDDRNGDEVRLRSIGVAVRRIDQEFGCAINFLSFGRTQCRKNLLTGHARVDLARVDLARVDRKSRRLNSSHLGIS